MNIIQIRNVNKKYKTGVMAVNNLSLDIEKPMIKVVSFYYVISKEE